MGPRAGLDRCGKSRPHQDFLSIRTHCSTWPLTSNEIRDLPNLVLIIHHLYDDWGIRRRHACRTPHTQHDTFLGGYGLTVVQIRRSTIATTNIYIPIATSTTFATVTPNSHFKTSLLTRDHAPGGWVSPRAGLERCGKSRPHRDSIPDLQPVASRYTE